MRVAVHQPAASRAPLDQGGDHRLGRLEHVRAGEQRHGVRVAAVLGHRVGHLEAMPRAELEVVGAVRGRDVHEARAFLGADEITRKQRHREVVALAVQGVTQDRSGKIAAGDVGHRAMAADPRLSGHLIDQARREHKPFADIGERAVGDRGHLDHPVLDVLAIRDRAVAGHGPGRGGPDQDRGAGERGMRGLDHGKRTIIVVEVWSRYSTSASARAVFSTTDHITDFLPRYSWPDSRNLPSSR